MSRRKQTNPFKVNWPFHMTGFSGLQHASEMEAKDDFAENTACHSAGCGDLDEQDVSTDESDSDLDKENSSGSSADDNMACHKANQCNVHGGSMKEESERESDLGGNYSCPICTLEFGSPDQLIAHVYQHTSAVGGSKSYVCPVCGRALSSPGSLGRHLLIHSDDRLSNCAVCGARFTDTNNFNREKLKEFLSASDLESSSGDQTCSMVQSVSDGHMSIHSVNHGATAGPGFPPLPGSLLSSGSALPSFPDSLNPLPDLLNPMPVYPAGVLLVCNSCAAYQHLADSPSSAMRNWVSRRRNEPTDVRMQRLERERVAKKSKRERETPEERELRRLRDREAKRMQRLQETQEQRARRLQRDREAMRLKRATETPERRQARLVREREAKRLKRRLDKLEPALRAQIEHDPAAVAALTADVNLFQFPFPVPVSSMDNGLFMKLP
ncbi:zinc finger protein 821 isoform X1 [Tachysurus fulvidraco]|uniref:zinc finger protein 821 isoform X1 n=2 Tax=Tachysurus fulvidraco TaxID=1234273 RepID=UPI000F515218|nr:zinc finger protein 821 isoform X1 [Tachysurus fulvidraco]